MFVRAHGARYIRQNILVPYHFPAKIALETLGFIAFSTLSYSSPPCSKHAKYDNLRMNLCSGQVGKQAPLHVQKYLQTASIFCFDVDSTLIKTETIDELAKFLGVGEEVKQLTRSAMGGSLNFTDALLRRLDLMMPSEDDLHRFQESHPLELTDGVSVQ